MRTRFAAVVVVLQVAVLGYMAAQREWVSRFGQPILLRTAPIDPNDPMRGFYARLNYDISSVPASLWRGGLKERAARNGYDQRPWRDLRVYAALKLDTGGIAELVSLSDERPGAGLYLAGRVNSADTQRINVRYGVEALFLQQGKSQQLEDARRQQRPGAPIDAEVAVNASGLAVLKGYHWEPLGMVATFERTPVPVAQPAANPSRPPRPRQVITAVKVELKNYGPETVAIVDLPAAGSFRLVANASGPEPRYVWVGPASEPAAPTAANIQVLKPGEARTTRIDLTRPEWFVIDTKLPAARQTPMPMRDITDVWSASFRLEYLPPSPERVRGLPNAELVRHSRLLSRAFNPGQGMD